MKIVFQHEGVLPVKKYGGIERILYWHMVELVKQGHEVVLIGNKDCDLEKVGITLIPLPEGYSGESSEWTPLVPTDADIIHLQYNHIPNIEIPTINTIHGNGKIGEVFAKNTVFVGKRHAEIHGSDQYIHNAIDLEEFPFNPKETKSWENFMFLAKGSWSVKNLKHCVKACKKSKKNLHIAGGRAYLPSRYIHNHGFVGGDEKMKIFSDCDAFLFPVRWEEPFGIAMIEAMSQGLPVIGSKYGSLPELITEDVGILCDNYDDLLAAISKSSNNFDPNKIRKYVEDNFGIKKYTEAYLEKYKKVIGNEELNSKGPTYQLQQKAETLLPF